MLSKKMARNIYDIYEGYKNLLEILILKQTELITTYELLKDSSYNYRIETLSMELDDYKYELQEINNTINSLVKIVKSK